MKNGITLVVFLVLSFLVGGVGGQATQSALVNWYPALEKPLLNPPNAVFPVVWTALFVAMSVAAWLVWREGWREPEIVKRALRLHFLQLLVNMAWSVVFFGMRWPLGGLLVLIPFWLIVALMAQEYHKVSKPAFWLTVPYLLWIGFAAFLNVAIVVLN